MAPMVAIEFIGQKGSKKCWLQQPMGKSQKYFKGNSSGFVPDYRHAVETMGETDGFGSSGRVDSEMTASKDSCASKRKCVSLNADGYDSFTVPMQVLPLSKMSRSDMKDLEFRLKLELEQVRVLKRKADSLSSNVVVLSSSSDIRSCSDGQKRPPLDGLPRSVEVSASHLSKKRAAPGRNGAHTKKSLSGCFEPVKAAAAPSTSNAMLMQQCESLLKRLMSHQYGWVFNTPVDVVKLNIPDYFTVIKHPMDLGSVKSKIASGDYSSPLGFAADVRLTFANAMKYNPPGNDVHIMAETLSKYFEVRWKAIEKKLHVAIDVESMTPRSGLHTEMESTIGMPPLKKKKVTSNDSRAKPEAVTSNDGEAKPEPVGRAVTDKEKHNLSTELVTLLGELPENIIDFLKEHSYNADQISEDEIEIDIDALSDDTLFQLRKLLDDYLLEKRKAQANAEPCEMELHNESGLSNSSLQPCKGNEQADGDIDVVGGNDPPISSYPSVKIDENAANRNSKCNSPSSSSRESGSSSSDSDSASSSSSDADAPNASVPFKESEVTGGSRENLEQNKGGLDDSGNVNQSINGLAEVELNSQDRSIVVEADGHQEENMGESSALEGQVSPERFYRAALLRNRFADTILKAQEKALEKGAKQDPEKLQMEREALERRQKEEKARLQAEAKAAEQARQKAEAKAAAEAQRKRELEREAARQALQQMEKTVDINENSQFMEDLEIFRTAHDEQVMSFIEETSPDHSQNELGSFKLRCTNPLEQLGLYMKEDDDDDDEKEEEEEEVEPPKSIPESAKDVEEGEID